MKEGLLVEKFCGDGLAYKATGTKGLILLSVLIIE